MFSVECEKVIPLKRRSRFFHLFAGFFAIVLAAPLASAQANYDGAVLGGRTAMMGGAAVARGSDGAVLFLNPAGITRIPGESFSFGTVALSFSHRFYSGAADPDANFKFSRPITNELELRVLPNTFCVFLDGPHKDEYSLRSRHKFGVCVADLEQDNILINDNRDNSRAAVSLASRVQFRRTTSVATWGVELMRGTNVGVSARLDNSGLDDATTAEQILPDLSRLTSMSHARRGVSWDSSVTLGLTHAVGKHLTVGASLTTPSQHIIGWHDGSDSMFDVARGTSVLSQEEGDYSYNMPGCLRLGLAFSWPRLNLEIDGHFYAGEPALSRARFQRKVIELDQAGAPSLMRSEGRFEVLEAARPVTNLSFGLEAFVQKDFSVLAGVQTDFTALAPRQPTSGEETMFRQSRDAISGALGVATYTERGTILLGLRGTYSEGTILMPDPSGVSSSFFVLPQTRYVISVVLSGHLSLEGVRDTAMRAAAPFLSQGAQPKKGGRK
jgi:hypothetical protein